MGAQPPQIDCREQDKLPPDEWLIQQYEQHQGLLAKIVRAYFPWDWNLQQDMTQQAIFKAWRWMVNNSQEEVRNPKQWLAQILHNVCLSEFRNRKRRNYESLNDEDHPIEVEGELKPIEPEYLGEGQDTLQDAVVAFWLILSHTDDEIVRAVQNASDEHIVIFSLFFRGYSYKQIAEMTEIPVPGIRRRLFSFRRRVRNQVEHHVITQKSGR